MAKSKSVPGRRPKGWDQMTEKEKQDWIRKIKRKAPSEDATLAQLKRFEHWLDSEIAKADRKASFKEEREKTKKEIEKKMSQISGVPTALRKKRK